MGKELLTLFKRIISEKTGFNVQEQDAGKVVEFIASRIKSLRISSPDEYYQILRNDKLGTKREWLELMNQLTTGETYFFRDKGQFTLLKNWVLPELIKNRKAERTLHIWSAGCSTGEEAYSIAILLDEIAQELEGWKILILGTDINEGAIDKARRGSYGEWSFRQVGDEIRKRYFRKKKNEWILDERIRGMVRLEVMNLITDTYPTVEANHELPLHNMDLIICRNVFIYFKPEVVSKVVEKMSGSLRDGGYLMTGHAEIRALGLPFLKAKVFPESVVYQKSAELGVQSEEKKAEFTLPLIPSRQGRGEVCAPFPQEREKIHVPSPLAGAGKGEGELKEAKAYADMGRHDEAIKRCKEALKIDPFSPEPYYLLAQIAREMGNLEEEKEMLKKVIYLNPSDVAGFLELAVIYDEEGDFSRALKMRKTALELLKRLPPEARIEPYEAMTVGEIAKHMEMVVKM